ncbi:hypothetical protein PoB_001949300, partial [Plakobranchus ocellatus]
MKTGDAAQQIAAPKHELKEEHDRSVARIAAAAPPAASVYKLQKAYLFLRSTKKTTPVLQLLSPIYLDLSINIQSTQ